MNKKAIIGIFLVILCLCVIVVLIFYIFAFVGIHIITTQRGSHTGYVTAIEENGIIFKTITVYFKTDTQSSQEDSYCLIDRSLLPILKQKEENKEKTTITFFDYFLTAMNECGSGVGIINGVK